MLKRTEAPIDRHLQSISEVLAGQEWLEMSSCLPILSESDNAIYQQNLQRALCLGIKLGRKYAKDETVDNLKRLLDLN